MHTDCDISLKNYNTFGVEAKAHRLVHLSTAQEAQQYFRQLPALPQPCLAIGGGSNILFSQDYPGTLYKIENKGIQPTHSDEQHIYIQVAAGELWDQVVAHCVAQGWGGIENLSLIPGTAGAAAVQNIGAYGVEIGQRISWVEAVDMHSGALQRLPQQQLQYAYRHSVFKHPKRKMLITHIGLRLDKTAHYELSYSGLREYMHAQQLSLSLSTLRQAVIAIRQSKLPNPKELGNAGSFFKNPVLSLKQWAQLQARYPQLPHYPAGKAQVKIPAAWLIENSKAQQLTQGDAAVYDRHALILVNKGEATGQQIVGLQMAIRQQVQSHFGIALEPEVLIL